MRPAVTTTLLVIGSPVLLVMGYLVGALPLSGAEPNGVYVDCGPALFGRPSPLPDPACAAAYAPMPQISILLILAGIVCALAAGVLLIKQQRVSTSADTQVPAAR
jgi:hypothetical protein